MLDICEIILIISAVNLTKPSTKMASIQELPDEILLKVICFLDIENLVKFGHVSKRMRKIRSDQSLWKKTNLSEWIPKRHHVDVPTDLVKMIIENGCKYLHSMKFSSIFMGSEEDLCLDKSSILINLDLKFCEANVKFFEAILASCHSLQKLSMAPGGKRKSLTSNMIGSIAYQNGHALQTLNLRGCSGLDLESIQKISTNCVQLKNIELALTELSEDSIRFLVNNLTRNVEIIDLGWLSNLKDDHLKVLVTRCNKLSVLNLIHTSITKDSLTHIVENLHQTLEKLDINLCEDIDNTKVGKLKSMAKLKELNFMGSDQEKEDLKKVMPFLRFGELITAD